MTISSSPPQPQPARHALADIYGSESSRHRGSQSKRRPLGMELDIRHRITRASIDWLRMLGERPRGDPNPAVHPHFGRHCARRGDRVPVLEVMSNPDAREAPPAQPDRRRRQARSRDWGAIPTLALDAAAPLDRDAPIFHAQLHSGNATMAINGAIPIPP